MAFPHAGGHRSLCVNQIYVDRRDRRILFSASFHIVLSDAMNVDPYCDTSLVGREQWNGYAIYECWNVRRGEMDALAIDGEVYQLGCRITALFARWGAVHLKVF